MEIENIFRTPLCLPLQYSLSAFKQDGGCRACRIGLECWRPRMLIRLDYRQGIKRTGPFCRDRPSGRLRGNTSCGS